ncbi:MAG: 3-isopropylmalate dehydratase small subunit [Myxococcota bacterium]|jgi:3-isopropylmalate/(R)-2-methylmalate dehydratase small subunit|nr:3-isopropylmalate dehydratase small subunit [Myxococcota bacterium]
MGNRNIDKVVGRGCVSRGDDVDTDRIIPARFMKEVTFDTMGEHLFEDAREAAKGNHPLDNEAFEGAQILIVGKNFGCGSSREHAPQALMRYGFNGFIGGSFAEIFAGNCTAMGLVWVTLPDADLAKVMDSVELDPTQEITIDVEARTVTYRDGTLACEIPDGTRKQLLEGTWDAMGLLLDAGDAIDQTGNALPYVSGY